MHTYFMVLRMFPLDSDEREREEEEEKKIERTWRLFSICSICPIVSLLFHNHHKWWSEAFSFTRLTE